MHIYTFARIGRQMRERKNEKKKMHLSSNICFSVPKNTYFQDNIISLFTKKYLSNLGGVKRRARNHRNIEKIMPYNHVLSHQTEK